MRRILCLLALLLTACSGRPPDNLGVHEGQLAACPSRPNCVSSQDDNAKHYVAPLQAAAPVEISHAVLLEILKHAEGARVVADEPLYIRAEFTSQRLKFVDDVEFQFDPLSAVIHVRSASRVGYSDLGVNRKRVEALRQQFNRTLGSSVQG